MLPRQHRLHLRTELKRIKKESRLFPGQSFGLLIVRGKATTKSLPAKLAFIISTKIHKKASQRNRIRRRLSEAVGILLPEVESGTETVFLVKKTILDKDLNLITKEVREVFQKAGLLKKAMVGVNQTRRKRKDR